MNQPVKKKGRIFIYKYRDLCFFQRSKMWRN